MSDKTIAKIIFFCVFISLNLMTSCKKAKTAVIPCETEKKIDYGAFYTDGLSSKKWVALTFDDGPKPGVLDKIFDTLKKENVKATFFLVGSNVKFHPQYVSKYLQLGHEIGNHTYAHRNYYQLKEKKSMEEIEKILTEELTASENVIKELTGVKPFFMRMPNGYISPMVKKAAKEKKYVIVNWTFGCDWHGYTKDELVKKYLRSIEPGAIFLFHEKKLTAEALPEIIAGIKKKGYEIVTLREILGLTSVK
ncbi:MAG: polysaccharide deacetylase family protein [Elusimicrobiota bacterium]